jgi:TPR repeat protein
MRLFQECHLSIAILYEKEHDYLKAEEHYTAVESSSVLPQLANCQYKMAVCYEKGKGVWKNEEEALEYYNRARTNGSIAASLCLLHKKYRPGYTADDYEKIEFDLIELIKLGSGDAYYEAGLLLFDPAYRNYYRQRLHGSAQAFFREAVDFGNVKAGFYLADLLLKENSNEPIIINLLESAIAINMPQAKYALAKLYNEGIIVPNNKLKAKLLFEEVLKYVSNADLSDGEAQYLYARLYFDGCAIERDTKKYMERLRLSAYYDYAIAIDELSSLYREGSIVSQSDDFFKAYIEKWGKERSCNTDNDDIEAYSKFSEK